MKKIFLALLLVPFLLISISEIYALEYNAEYFIDSENSFIIINIDSSGKTTLLEGGFVIDDKWEYWETTNLKISRILSDGETGRFFGKSDAGNFFYSTYDVSKNDEGFLNTKVWHDGIKSQITEKATVVPLF